jgi:FkbM family methyltransferase
VGEARNQTFRSTWRRRLFRSIPPGTARRVARLYYLFQHLRRPRVEPELALLRSLVSPGQRVLDIGANFGFYTVPLARAVGPEGEVHAFEPIPETCEVLRFVLRRLGLNNVVVHECAVADQVGEAPMTIPADASGTENLYLPYLGSDPRSVGRVLNVTTTTIDEVCTNASVHAIKCDVEGAELAALRGGLGTIRRDHPLILIEAGVYPARMGSTAGATWKLLEGAGYSGFALRNERLESAPEWDASTTNYFFMHSEWSACHRIANGGRDV